MKKILVVDDDIATRKIISRALEDAGFCVTLASDGTKAQSIIQDNPDFSLLITDMQMPGMDGRELIKKLQSNNESVNLPVIIVSGIIPLKDIIDLLEKGAQRFIPKPINRSELVNYAKDLINGLK